MKKWIGNWMIGVATIHTLFAIFMFRDAWMHILNNGVFNTIGDDRHIASVVFFFLWGLIFYAFAFSIKALEKNNIELPKILGVGLLINAVISVVLVPDSGYWLLFVPAVAIILRLKTKKSKKFKKHQSIKNPLCKI